MHARKRDEDEEEAGETSTTVYSSSQKPMEDRKNLFFSLCLSRSLSSLVDPDSFSSLLSPSLFFIFRVGHE